MWTLIQNVMQDFRFAARQLRKAPGFALTVVVTLGLGIGATTAVYSIVNAVLLRPLPFPEPERLMALTSMETIAGGTARADDVSYPNFYDWRAQNKSFQSMASYKTDGFTLARSANDTARRTTGVVVSSDFFRTLGVTPELGRDFRREEEQAQNRAVIIGYKLWQSEFNGARDVVGMPLRLNDKQYTVIGVMAADVVFPVTAPDAEFWVTPAQDAEGKNASATQRGWTQLDVVGRLRDRVTASQAAAEMSTIQRALAAHYPEDDKNLSAVTLKPELESVVGDARKPLQILFAAVALLLMIACANAAGLFMTRASGRLPELSIRAALGATRSRLMRQLLLESVALSMAGGALGLGFAAALVKAAPHLLPANLARAEGVALDGAVLGFALAASILTGIVFGVVPAWWMTRHDPAATLRDGGRGVTAGTRQNSFHAGLVICETALSMILLVMAGLLIRSFDRVMHVDPGFDPQHLLTFRIATPEARYTGAQRVAFYNSLLSRLQALPGVESATGAFPLPLAGGNIRLGFTIVAQPVAPGDEPSERLSLVEPRFFETMRISLRQGRFFASQEQKAQGPPVVIVNEAFAKKYFPGGNAIGARMRSDLDPNETPVLREIVGVVGDVKRSNLIEAAKPEYYVPIEQAPIAPPAIAMRVAGDPASYANAVRATVAEMDRGLPVYRLRGYTEELSRSTAQQSFETLLMSGFAAISLALAAVGLYALLGYVVVQRRMELSLRMALGAQRGDVLGMILRRGLTLTLFGLSIGISVSLLLTRYVASELFGVKAMDSGTFGTVTAVLLLVAVLTSLVPAYRASRLDPINTLRMQ